MKTIYVAGGCFWGVEKYFKNAKGIINTSCGYAQSDIADINYEQTCLGIYNAVEAVYIEYDERIISIKKILELLFRIIDPTAINKQGNDVGVQYRTGIYYTDISDEKIINECICEQSIKYDKITVEVMQLKNYYLAEEHHQDYLTKNPTGYCHIDLFSLKFDERK